jgi:dimethylargininase
VSSSFKALTRRPAADMGGVELTHIKREPIDGAVAGGQHDAYRAALADAGADLIDLPPLAAHPDAVFVEDVLLALPEAFVLTRPGALSRRGEVASVEAALPADRPVLRLAEPATLDGGDVLRLGRTLYVGRSSRTNEAGVDALRGALSPWNYRVEGVDLAGALHLKTVVSPLPGGVLLIDPKFFPADPFDGASRIEIHPAEPEAPNSVCPGGRVILQMSCPRTAERVFRAGFEVALLDVGEFNKAEAGLSCMSVLIPAAA